MADREEQVNTHIYEEETSEEEAPPKKPEPASEKEPEKEDYNDDFDTSQEAPRNPKPSSKKRKAVDDDDDDDNEDDDDLDADLRPKKKTSRVLSDEALKRIWAPTENPNSDIPEFMEYIHQDSTDADATEQDLEDLSNFISNDQNGSDDATSTTAETPNQQVLTQDHIAAIILDTDLANDQDIIGVDEADLFLDQVPFRDLVVDGIILG